MIALSALIVVVVVTGAVLRRRQRDPHPYAYLGTVPAHIQFHPHDDDPDR